jgi:hypothetical protein
MSNRHCKKENNNHKIKKSFFRVFVIGQKILIYDWWKMSKAQLLAQVTALTQENDRLQKELDSIKSSAKTSEVTYRFIDF